MSSWDNTKSFDICTRIVVKDFHTCTCICICTSICAFVHFVFLCACFSMHLVARIIDFGWPSHYFFMSSTSSSPWHRYGKVEVRHVTLVEKHFSLQQACFAAFFSNIKRCNVGGKGLGTHYSPSKGMFCNIFYSLSASFIWGLSVN